MRNWLIKNESTARKETFHAVWNRFKSIVEHRSGDSHLLALDSFRGIKMVGVKQMLTCLEEKTS
jgi:hypothetical protein